MHEFIKMHGAGNDFIIADNRKHEWPQNADFIKQICDRRQGIGADGFILLSAPSSSKADITMSFFNCDGNSAEMCGNGLRCAALFTYRHILGQSHLKIETASGILNAEIIDEHTVTIEIPIKKQPQSIEIDDLQCYSANTGVPHLVIIVKDVSTIDIDKEGKKYRHHPLFQDEGTNVNFISIPEQKDEPIAIRTYERGVEGETTACGTGVAAAAISLSLSQNFKAPIKFVTAHSDTITVDFCRNDNMVALFSNILLSGPAVEVYKGNLKVE